jgi:hypothetical protein
MISLRYGVARAKDLLKLLKDHDGKKHAKWEPLRSRREDRDGARSADQNRSDPSIADWEKNLNRPQKLAPVPDRTAVLQVAFRFAFRLQQAHCSAG